MKDFGRHLRCPRCGGAIPNMHRPGQYPGAISRWDNATEICSVCGVDEAIGRGMVDATQWPLDRPEWYEEHEWMSEQRQRESE